MKHGCAHKSECRTDGGAVGECRAEARKDGVHVRNRAKTRKKKKREES